MGAGRYVRIGRERTGDSEQCCRLYCVYYAYHSYCVSCAFLCVPLAEVPLWREEVEEDGEVAVQPMRGKENAGSQQEEEREKE